MSKSQNKPLPVETDGATQAPKIGGFEKSLDELEGLVAKLEAGELSLEDSLASYERGVKLFRDCQQALAQAELRVRLLGDPDRPDDATPFDDANDVTAR